MKKRKVIELLINDYSEAINKIKTSKLSKERSIKFLCSKNLEEGVCNALEGRGIRHYTQKWIIKHTMTGNSFSYWCSIPELAGNRRDVIYRLQYRLDILNKELLTCK
jgi:hypothetical protein